VYRFGRPARYAAAAVLAVALAGWVFVQPAGRGWGSAAVRPNLEARLEDGSPYTPSTQSFLRGYHWLDRVDRIEISAGKGDLGRLRLSSPDGEHELVVDRLPLRFLVPRLHYRPGAEPDAFDALNLRLAEYSRVGLGVPSGRPGDARAHFETTLAAEMPWTLEDDYRFVPRPDLRPLRVAVINNCLASGLWELSATDAAGEIYHGWFDLPSEPYFRLVAAVNGVGESFAREATAWSSEPAPLRLERLRRVDEDLGRVRAVLAQDEAAGFSTQDSRRKLAKSYALVADTGSDDGGWRRPRTRGELTAGNVRMSSFVPPGRYSLDGRREFDFRFLTAPAGADVRRVTPATSYRFDRRGTSDAAAGDYLEIDLELAGHRLVLGNLPLALQVPQEDFVLHGFGVGILDSGGLAERQQFLIDDGPAPSFAYLVDRLGAEPTALNSHDYGIEQVFVRTHSRDPEPWFEITVTSFERIVDLVKYRVEIPLALHGELRRRAAEYVSPLYFTYRDDNLR
jgi:hypothetical protein